MSQDTKKIGVNTATIIGMNAMIGAGIFTAPATIASNVGPAGILAYGLVICAVWFMALSLARLAYLFPEEGSFYIYAKAWGGHITGVIASSAYFIGLLIAMGLLSQMAGAYLHDFFPGISAYNLGLIALVTLVILNTFGVVLSQLGQQILIVCTIFPIIVTTIMCLSKASLSNLMPFAPFGYTNVLKATKVVIFGFFGFECASSLFNIVENPKKNVPKALIYSIIAVGILYTLFFGSIILSTPLNLFTDPRIPLSKTLTVVFPNSSWIIGIIHFAILSAILGTVHSMIWTSSNLLALLMKNFRTPALKSLSHKQWFKQYGSVLAVGIAIATSYVTLKNPNLFFSLTSLFIISAFLLSMVSLLVVKNELKAGHKFQAVIGMCTALLIFYFAADGLCQEIFKL